MNVNKNPAPRGNAGNRGFARHFPMMPATLAAVLAALASLGRAFQ
jgi:hypothetical protein